MPQIKEHMPLILSRLVPALICGLFLYVAYLVMTTRYVPEPPLKSLLNWQEADAPYGIPIDNNKPDTVQRFNPQFNMLNAFEEALIPSAPRFQAAMGAENGSLSYNAQAFWQLNDGRGGYHMGDDINGIGGQNTDLGDPVYAVANGLVVYRGTPSSGWGKTIILAHRASDGRRLFSMYAHLLDFSVSLNSYVGRGKKIGRVGTANGQYLAHLHLEMRHAEGISPQAGYSAMPFDRLNPEQTISALSDTDPSSLHPAVFSVIEREIADARDLPEMDAESALMLQKFLNRSKKEKQKKSD